MKKIIISTLVILLLVVTITSVTFAWFTYVERKSVAAFEAGELKITTKANGSMFNFDLLLDDLAFIDYQNEVILDKYQTFNEMALSLTVEIKTDSNAPLSKHKVTIDETNLIDGLMYVLVYEGYNIDQNHVFITDYHTYLTYIISGYATKIDQLNAIEAHNQAVLDQIYNQVLFPDETITLQIICWGDYDELTTPQTYLDETFILSLIIDSINDKGEIN